jgi:hypothetical protein
MRVGDALSLNPASIAFLSGDKDAETEHDLVSKYLSSPNVLTGCKRDALAPMTLVSPFQSLTLQQRESEAHKTENDEYFLMDDPKVSLPFQSQRWRGSSHPTFCVIHKS